MDVTIAYLLTCILGISKTVRHLFDYYWGPYVPNNGWYFTIGATSSLFLVACGALLWISVGDHPMIGVASIREYIRISFLGFVLFGIPFEAIYWVDRLFIHKVPTVLEVTESKSD